VLRIVDEQARVEFALDNLIREIGPSKVKYLNEDNSVWAEGKCFPSISSSVYHGCLINLRENILSECQNRKGCNFRVNDCSIRYELYRF